MPNKFNIDYFKPTHLQKTNARIEQYLKEIEKKTADCREEIKDVLDKPTWWQRIKAKLHLG